MGKNTKVMPQNALLSIFSLGKGREYLHLKPYEKLSVQVHFLTCPQHALITKSVDDAPQNCRKNEHLTRILHLSSNRRERNSALISDYDPNKKAHPRHEFQTQQNYSTLQTREPSNSDPK